MAAEFKVRVRTYTGGKPIATVWLVEQDGPAEKWVLFGEPGPKQLERLVKFLEEKGIEIIREVSALEAPKRIF